MTVLGLTQTFRAQQLLTFCWESMCLSETLKLRLLSACDVRGGWSFIHEWWLVQYVVRWAPRIKKENNIPSYHPSRTRSQGQQAKQELPDLFRTAALQPVYKMSWSRTCSHAAPADKQDRGHSCSVRVWVCVWGGASCCQDMIGSACCLSVSLEKKGLHHHSLWRH